MNKNDEYKEEFLNESCLYVAIPIMRAGKSWLFIEDVGKKEKARDLYFDALGNSKLYMASVNNVHFGFVKLYIVSTGNNTVRRLFVRKELVCPGERYHL